MSFKEGDTVRVTSTEICNSGSLGKTGKVVKVFEDGQTYNVNLEWPAPEGSMFDTMGVLVSFFESELELFDPKREALIELAETLDKARLQANAIPETADQNGTYGKIVQALTETLGSYFYASNTHYTMAYKAYESIAFDGNTVREALKAVEKDGE